MKTEFIEVKSKNDQKKLANLAGSIWCEYWPAIIGEKQTEYMIENFQSLDAIERDMSENAYEYWFITCTENGKERIVGYTGGHAEPETNRFFISKIYLLKPERGHGFASRTIQFYTKLCQKRGLHAAYLTVNKHNELGIRAYLGKGFKTIDAVETDIGNGFIMDDYIMELEIS